MELLNHLRNVHKDLFIRLALALNGLCLLGVSWMGAISVFTMSLVGCLWRASQFSFVLVEQSMFFLYFVEKVLFYYLPNIGHHVKQYQIQYRWNWETWQILKHRLLQEGRVFSSINSVG